MRNVLYWRLCTSNTDITLMLSDVRMLLKLIFFSFFIPNPLVIFPLCIQGSWQQELVIKRRTAKRHPFSLAFSYLMGFSFYFLFSLCACVKLSGRIISAFNTKVCAYEHPDAVPETIVKFVMTYNCLWLWDTSVFWQGWPFLIGFMHNARETDATNCIGGGGCSQRVFFFPRQNKT